MTHTTKYKLADAERQKRMDEFAQTDQPAALAAELAAARLMAEEAINAGHNTLAAGLLQTIAKLGNAHTASQLRLGELLEKAAVLELGTQLVGIISEEIAGRFDGWEIAVEAICNHLTATIQDTDNEPKLLTDERSRQ